jgi:hypothetical protein
MTSYKVLIKAHGSPSEEQLTAFTDAIGHDAVVSGGPDCPVWSVTFTVEATGSSRREEVGDASRKIHDIFYGAVISYDGAPARGVRRGLPGEGPPPSSSSWLMPGLPLDLNPGPPPGPYRKPLDEIKFWPVEEPIVADEAERG